ncbi:MAG: nucleotidyltransferase domain-containing protein [Clostridia bacterium]|nr:nucleotidyltransferase domain-containing protein [Clostridia bacterium]
MTLKELRLKNGLTQAKCAEYLGVPLRTYQNYEKDEGHGSSIKVEFMYDRLQKYGFVDEEHGVLTVEKITKTCKKVFEGVGINYCYLFGSYAKGTATEKSDVDLLVSTEFSGMIFYALVENLREELKKKVDLITKEQLDGNPELLNEILKYGIKIYG